MDDAATRAAASRTRGLGELRFFFASEHDDEARGFFDVHGGVVQEDRVFGADEGRNFAFAVALVALMDFFEYLREGHVLALLFVFLAAAFGTSFGSGFKEDFQLGVGENDSADVAAFHDDTTAGTGSLLLCDEKFADFGDDGHLGSSLGDFGSSDGLRDVEAIEKHLVLDAFGNQVRRRGLQFDGGRGGEIGELFFRRESETVVLQCLQGKSTVHGARVEIQVAEDLRDALGDATFAGAGRTVDRDGEFRHETILFQKPMML